MKKISLLFIACISLFSCSNSESCPDGINLLPMYGQVKKCAAQIQYDNEFLAQCDKINKDRKQSAKEMVSTAWGYYYAGKQDTAMRRFNQAWLLDSLNTEVYWGFANIEGTKKKYRESLPLFARAIKLNPGNAKIWESASVSYGQLFVQSQDVKLLDTSILYLKKAIALQPGNPATYGQLTGAYTYFNQKDSALKYLAITDKLDKNAIHPEVRKILANARFERLKDSVIIR